MVERKSKKEGERERERGGGAPCSACNVVTVSRGGVKGGGGDKIKVSRPLFKIVFLSRARAAVAVLAGSVASTVQLNP